jgi:hypothetical protein
MNRIRIGMMVCALLVQGLLFSQPRISLKMDTSDLLIGDHIPIEVVLAHPSRMEIRRVDLPLTDSSGLELLEESSLMRINDSLVQKTFLLTAFDSGFYRVPPVTVLYSDGKEERSVRSQPFNFRMETLPVSSDSAVLQPIKPILEEPVRGEDFLPYLIALVLAAAIGLVIWWVIRIRRKPREVPPPLPIFRPAHELALRELEEMLEKEEWATLSPNAFYVKVTYTLRDYLEKRFQIEALERTTTEMGRLIQNKSLLTDPEREGLLRLLKEGDLVKFAQSSTQPEQRRAFLKKAIDWVMQTADEEVQIAIPENE